MPTSRLVLIAIAASAVSLESGCSSSPLREGIWELSFAGQRVQNRKEFPIDPREVQLLVEEKDGGDGEIVEISSLEDDIKPMYGDIKRESEEKTVLTVDHQDGHWHWRMYGVIRDPEHVMGQLFFASARQHEDLTIEGRWNLRWLRDN